MQLASVASSRDNNFNLMRVLAALAVVVSHSYPLVYGHNGREPLYRLVGTTIGSVAVDAFFVISGFLNTQSLIRAGQPGRFVLARALRIFPALWVMVLVTTVATGIWFSALPFGDYLSRPATLAYVFRNSTLLFGAAYELPALEHVPYPFIVNGSLWSLPIEVRMYLGLLVIWLLTNKLGSTHGKARRAILPVIAVLSGLYFLWARDKGSPWLLEARLLCLFAQGATYAAWQDEVQLRTFVFAALVFLIGTSTWWPAVFYPVYVIGFPYVLLYLAYVPAGWIRGFNRWGDASYGIYIYAFPVQQAVVAMVNPRSVLNLVAVATPFIVVMAIASWRFIEKPALSLKPKSRPASAAIKHPAAN